MRWHWSSQERVLTEGCQECGRQTQLEAELEAALERKEGGQRPVTCRTVWAFVAALPDRRERAALRREQLTSDRVKARQNRLANLAGFKEGDRVWLYSELRKVNEVQPGSTTCSTGSCGTLERRW
jgi:hypothetical protein